jgi:polyisoprenoid-binding protein YceI
MTPLALRVARLTRPWSPAGAFLALAATAALAAAAPALGEPLTLRLDPKASAVRFTVDAFAHTIHGSFAVESGAIQFDPSTGAASGEVVVDAKSGETGNGSRDGKMHSSVLESARFPQIVFTATRVSGAFARDGASQLQLGGTIRLHGASHPVLLAVTAQSGAGKVTATAPLTVPFVEWGLEDPSNFVLRIAKQVEVEIHAQGALE